MNDQELRDFYNLNGYAGPFPSLSSESFRNLQSKTRRDNRWGLGILRLLLHKTGILKRNPEYEGTAHIKSKLAYGASVDKEILKRVSAILGQEFVIWRAHVICRWPGHKGVNWHIDLFNAKVEGVHVSIALSEMNLKNGCLQVIPGTHKYNVDLDALARKGECDLSDAQSMVRLADRVAPEHSPHQVISMELKPGEYFFTRGGLWHGVVANHSLSTRMAMVTRFMKSEFEKDANDPVAAIDW